MGEPLMRKKRYLAEAAAGYEGFEVAIGGGDDADVGVAGFVAAQTDDFAGLQDAQEFGLHGEGHVADFVEEECAAVGVLEDARALLVGAGEGTLTWPKSWSSRRVSLLAGAVEGDVAGGGAVAELVWTARAISFLAGAALAGDEDGDVGGGDEYLTVRRMRRIGRTEPTMPSKPAFDRARP